ncbi:MAG: alpha/beta fold hydrolase [Paraglaciecola sp.]|uniref:alpha/beta hydrolase family protein n=1 Tax=Paraglaciecola sp. TaxID=1920173 RepID=UPI003297860F
MIKICSITLFLLFTLVTEASSESNISSFKDVELLIAVNDVQIGGTLTLPNKNEVDSLVILSSGSGPQDRDETLDGFKIFKVIAEHLALQGIASFRYDDRGVGESSGVFQTATLDDHARDLKGMIKFFKASEIYSFKDFILFGHSQGGISSTKVAINNSDIKSLVLMGAPSAPLIDIVLYQIRQEYNLSPISRHFIEAEVSAHNKLMSAIRNNRNKEQALKEFELSTVAVMSRQPANEGLQAKKIEEMATNKTKEFEIVYALPSLTSYLYHDTSLDYSRLNIPVLSLFGGKDLQVTIEQHKDRMENAFLASGTPYQFVTFDDANHYFQTAKSGKRDEYGTLEKRFVSGFLETISAWILELTYTDKAPEKEE